MAKLVCEDCGEVVEDDLEKSEADDIAEDEAREVKDERTGQDEGGDGSAPGQGSLDDRTDIEDLDEDVEEEFEEKRSELDDEVDDVVEDVEDYDDADDADTLEFEVGNDDTAERPGWSEREDDARRIASVFRDKLRQKKRDKEHRAQRTGQFDSQRAMQASRGSSRVFKQTQEGRNPDYEAYFVFDRSGSMSGDWVAQAEDALATLMIALEDVDIATELVDFYGGQPRVIKTKSQDLEEEKNNIYNGEAHGGTPLAHTIGLMAERIEGHDSAPFLVVITDGKESATTKYLDALETLNQKNVPVLGVTMGDAAKLDNEDKDRLYNTWVTVESADDVTQRLEDLVRNVVI